MLTDIGPAELVQMQKVRVFVCRFPETRQLTDKGHLRKRHSLHCDSLAYKMFCCIPIPSIVAKQTPRSSLESDLAFRININPHIHLPCHLAV